SRKSESPRRKRSPKRDLSPKKRVEEIEEKRTDGEEEGRDPGKRPFVAAITGGPFKPPANLSTN
ncbi:hypothetical protein A2U01_0078712, partial [Trifolium medium]|nr:hypothetical protein [Trifolium medium]